MRKNQTSLTAMGIAVLRAWNRTNPKPNEFVMTPMPGNFCRVGSTTRCAFSSKRVTPSGVGAVSPRSPIPGRKI